jgi:AraC-like DNA-binding protein
MVNSYELIVSHPKVFKTLAVKDLLFAHYICPQEEKQVASWTEYNVIGFTLNGNKKYHHRGKTWMLTRDNALFSKKGAFTQEVYLYDGWEVLAFYIPDDYLKKVFKEYRSYLRLGNLPPVPEDPMLVLQIDDRIRVFFRSILVYFSMDIPAPEDLLELKFRELLFSIFSIPANGSLLAYVNSLIDQYRTPLWQVMESNFMFNLSIPEYARMAQRSVSTFKREFREAYHTSPGRWLTQKRLEYSKMLLETSRSPVSDVAYESGFENLSHFSRVFKERYRISPTRYRHAQLQ